MRTVGELLRTADPLRYEGMWSPRERLIVEERVLAHLRDGPGRVWSRRSMIAAAASMTLLAAVLVSRTTVLVVQAAVRFEVRLAEDSQAPGFDQIQLPTGRTVYLHPQPVVSNADIAAAQVVPGSIPTAFEVEVRFNAEGADKMVRATRGHVGKPVAILIDGIVVAVPVLRSPVRDHARITGDFTRVEAQRIADGLIGQ
jgi:preprotein translocase subunit SecD